MSCNTGRKPGFGAVTTNQVLHTSVLMVLRSHSPFTGLLGCQSRPRVGHQTSTAATDGSRALLALTSLHA